MLRNESYRKGIINSSVSNVVGKSAAFIQQWLIGYYFGINSDTDVFFFTYNIILFASFFFLNFTTSVLIPEGMKIREQENEEESKQFFNSYIFAYAMIGIIVMLIVGCMPEFIIGCISSFGYETIENNITLIQWCIPIIFLNFIVSIISEILVSYKYFTIPNIITLVNYSIGIAFIISFHDTLGLNAIAIGLVIGYIINLILVSYIIRKELNWEFLQPINFRFKKIFKGAFYSQTGYIVYLAAMYVPQNIFTSLPAGYLSAINFADKILTIPSIFLVGQITNVMAVKINNMVASNKLMELSRLIEKILITTMAGLMLTAVIISISSGLIVDLLFAWGNYNMDSMSVTVRILSAMIFYLPFSFAFSIFMKLCNAFKKQDKFFYLQTFTQALTIVLYFYFIPSYGIYTYPSCRIAPYIIASLCAIYILRNILPNMRIQRITIVFLSISVVTSIILAYDFMT